MASFKKSGSTLNKSIWCIKVLEFGDVVLLIAIIKNELRKILFWPGKCQQSAVNETNFCFEIHCCHVQILSNFTSSVPWRFDLIDRVSNMVEMHLIKCFKVSRTVSDRWPGDYPKSSTRSFHLVGNTSTWRITNDVRKGVTLYLFQLLWLCEEGHQKLGRGRMTFCLVNLNNVE